MGKQVVLVCGPPCSGKTTYVAQHAQPGDLILDHDDLAREAGSPVGWMHEPHYADLAEQAMTEGINLIANSDDIRAWVIRSLPEGHARDELAVYLGAEVVVLTPDRDLLRARAASRPARTRQIIAMWFARYSPGRRDG